MIDVITPHREVTIERFLREVDFHSPLRSVDVTMTYTFEEFYFVTPFQVDEDLKEGTLWSTK